MVETVYCVHCGAVAKHPVTKAFNGRPLQFCCRGCLQVYEMMHEEELLAGPNDQAAPAQAPTPVQDTRQRVRVTLAIGGMSCANCVASVDRSLRALPGVLNVQVDLATGQAQVEMTSPPVSASDLRRAVEKAGYTVSS